MNPYEADPAKIPPSDRYADEPSYGRYLPQPDDFKPNPAHIGSTSAKSLSYWSSVLDSCSAVYRIYENEEGCRDVFAFGSVIIKSTHLQGRSEGDQQAQRDYSLADANEVKATALAREALKDVRVPRIYFAGQVNLLPPFFLIWIHVDCSSGLCAKTLSRSMVAISWCRRGLQV